MPKVLVQHTIDKWFEFCAHRNPNAELLPLVKALPEIIPPKSPTKPLVAPSVSSYFNEICGNVKGFSDCMYNHINSQWTSNTGCFIVTFTHNVSQIRTYNNAQLKSLFCYKIHNFCKLNKVKITYVVEYTKSDVPHYHGILYFDRKKVSPKWRSRCFNILGDTLIGNISSPSESYFEDQWKRKKDKTEKKVQTRKRSLRNVTDYLAKITSKKRADWFLSYDEDYTYSGANPSIDAHSMALRSSELSTNRGWGTAPRTMQLSTKESS